MTENSVPDQIVSIIRIHSGEEPGLNIEDPCSKLQGHFDRKEVYHFQIRSLSPQSR
jgi:hypothetical protein